MQTKRMVEDIISRQLEERTFDDILEDFDLDPVEIFWMLFKNGHIDHELFERIYD